MSVSTDYKENFMRVHIEGQQLIVKGIAQLRINGMEMSDKEILSLIKELLGDETKGQDLADRSYLFWSDKKART